MVDELSRIKWAREGVGSNIPGYNKRSLTFSLFDDIISAELKTALIDGVDKVQDVDQYVAQFDKKLSVEFKKYFDKVEQENWDEFSTSPHISNELLAKVKD